MQRIFLAIDIGASSGRHIVGIEADGALQTDEVYRFPNGMQRENGHLIWDIEGIFQHVKAGIKAAFAKYPHIDSLSIDTWAVDYVLLKDGAALLPCHAYRDERTQAVIDEVHQHMPFAELYRRTRSMTLGRTLWAVILIKLFIMFAILRLFFFPDVLGRFQNDIQKGEYVRERFIEVKP